MNKVQELVLFLLTLCGLCVCVCVCVHLNLLSLYLCGSALDIWGVCEYVRVLVCVSVSVCVCVDQ